jgi:TonB-dependent receptor
MKSYARLRLSLVGAAVAAALAAPLEAQEGEEAQGSQDVQPEDGGQAPADPNALPEGVTDEVIAVGRLRSSAVDVVVERLEQEVVSDFLGAAQISRTGDSTVSLALRRVPGLTLVNDQYIYVRGLGERYSSTQLNSAYVPSPDLTRNVLPLDIFPAEIIEALAVQKGYSPDMPAAFGGGNVNIITRSIPERPVVSVEVQSGYNSESSDDGITYVGGHDDSLGTDDGTRALPDAIWDARQEYLGNITATGIYNGLTRDGNVHTFAEAEAINRNLATSLYRNIDFQNESLSPDAGLEAAFGNSWYLGDTEQWRVGALNLLSYDNTWRNRERVVRNVLNPSQEYFVEDRTTNQVTATGVLNLGLSFGNDHQVSTNSLYLRNTEDKASVAAGHTFNFQQASGRGFRDYRIRFEERNLRSNQIRGHHVVGADTVDILPFLDNRVFNGLTYDWYYSESTVETDIPSEILISGEDQVNPQTGEFISTSLRRTSSAANYRYTDLQDEVESYGWDLMKPVRAGNADIEVSGGWDYSRKAREYLQNELTLGTTAAAAVPILTGTPGTVLTDANILNPINQFGLSIGGIGTESYLAAQTIEGAYLKFDALFSEAWRLSGGMRWEQFQQVSLPIDTLEFDPRVGQSGVPTNSANPDDNAAALLPLVFMEDDVYPALSLTYMHPGFWAETFQLRFGASETVARPDLREISDATYIDPLTDARVSGAPGLQTSPISNYDIRAEWFFDSGDNFTLSLFHKDIESPIETAEGAGSDNNVFVTFINADSAEVSGLEVEWFKNLATFGDRWGRWIEPFFFSGNLTLGESNLIVGDVGLDLTNPERPMTGHSEYVANLQLGFDSSNGAHSWSLVYNTFGERVFFAGRGGAEDVYEQPFDSLDLIYTYYPTDHLSFKFRFQNILDEKLELEQSGIVILEQNVGTTAKIDIKWDLGG